MKKSNAWRKQRICMYAGDFLFCFWSTFLPPLFEGVATRCIIAGARQEGICQLSTFAFCRPCLRGDSASDIRHHGEGGSALPAEQAFHRGLLRVDSKGGWLCLFQAGRTWAAVHAIRWKRISICLHAGRCASLRLLMEFVFPNEKWSPPVSCVCFPNRDFFVPFLHMETLTLHIGSVFRTIRDQAILMSLLSTCELHEAPFRTLSRLVECNVSHVLLPF